MEAKYAGSAISEARRKPIPHSLIIIIIIIIMVIFKCYFSGELVDLSLKKKIYIKKKNNGVNIELGKTNRLKHCA